MAANSTFSLFWQGSGPAQNAAVYVVYSATAAQTVDVAAQFVKVTTAYCTDSTGTATSATCSVSGTTITIPAGPSVDDVFLFVKGARVQQAGISGSA